MVQIALCVCQEYVSTFVCMSVDGGKDHSLGKTRGVSWGIGGGVVMEVETHRRLSILGKS